MRSQHIRVAELRTEARCARRASPRAIHKAERNRTPIRRPRAADSDALPMLANLTHPRKEERPMKTSRMQAEIVVTSWLATLILTVLWVAGPSRRLLTAQQTATSTTAANSNRTAGSAAPALASQVDPNLQVLTQGPVHEAFGQPVLFNPAPNPVIPNKPPAPVEEIPPSMKPAGNDVEWIPGYWSWDVMQQKFVWTSGIW